MSDANETDLSVGPISNEAAAYKKGILTQPTSSLGGANTPQSYASATVRVGGKSYMPPSLSKQLGHVMRQKDLLAKLQHEKELIRRQLEENQRVMDQRMASVHEERL